METKPSHAALCPACQAVVKHGAAFCFGCFCKLSLGVKYMLADTHRRLEAIHIGVDVLKRIEADKKAARGGSLFQGEKR